MRISCACVLGWHYSVSNIHGMKLSIRTDRDLYEPCSSVIIFSVTMHSAFCGWFWCCCLLCAVYRWRCVAVLQRRVTAWRQGCFAFIHCQRVAWWPECHISGQRWDTGVSEMSHEERSWRVHDSSWHAARSLTRHRHPYPSFTDSYLFRCAANLSFAFLPFLDCMHFSDELITLPLSCVDSVSP